MFTKILLPVDLSHEDHIRELMRVAAKMVEGESPEVHMLYVDQSLIHTAGYPHLDEQSLADHRRDAKATMDRLLAALPAGLAGFSHCREGTAHDQILETAEELGVNVIVMMARKPGISSYFIGSNAERVVRHAGCSVVIVRQD
ncbi:universal stress protein [Pontibacterium granulatum]|uniref:universal stress protein n=1 Tax=Pontibacterium granulatum TaxID=2036029 RepID=UPI00249A5E0F|nr:universal stress protein [Pontibacterium granulatum]MDI3323282.1 universal stress protein [Pontibacterium granulatum]